MGLLESLIIGSYVWTTGIAAWLSQRIDKTVSNHILHLSARVVELEKHLIEEIDQRLYQRLAKLEDKIR